MCAGGDSLFIRNVIAIDLSVECHRSKCLPNTNPFCFLEMFEDIIHSKWKGNFLQMLQDTTDTMSIFALKLL